MIKFLQVKDRIDKIFAGIAKGAQFVSACFLVVMICTVSVQVVGRVLHFKVPITEELGTYSLIWMTYIASIAVLIKGEHLVVDLFLSRYKPGQRRVVRVFVDVLLLIFCGMLMIFGFQLCCSPIILNGRTPALQISRLYVYLSVPISMTFCSFYNLHDLIVAIADMVFKGGLVDVENARKAEEEAKHAEERVREEAEFRKAFLVTNDEDEEEKQ